MENVQVKTTWETPQDYAELVRWAIKGLIEASAKLGESFGQMTPDETTRVAYSLENLALSLEAEEHFINQ